MSIFQVNILNGYFVSDTFFRRDHKGEQIVSFCLNYIFVSVLIFFMVHLYRHLPINITPTSKSQPERSSSCQLFQYRSFYVQSHQNNRGYARYHSSSRKTFEMLNHCFLPFSGIENYCATMLCHVWPITSLRP